MSDGLPFTRAGYVFAEHFIEHFEFGAAIGILEDCRRLLEGGGTLRLSTPNLDWVWGTAYSTRWRYGSSSFALINPQEWTHGNEAAIDCLEINRAFRAWGHKFLFNRALLTQVLLCSGFKDLRWCSYGTSDHEELSGLERHEKSPGIGETSSVLIVEASCGTKADLPKSLADKMAEFSRDTAIS